MNSQIPKTLLQISIERPPEHVIEMSKRHCLDWKYIHFDDHKIIKFLEENPSDEFPNIIGVLKSFSHGAHRADLFRYYYLYLNGGFYLDSDAVLECNIESIVGDHEFVTIQAYHENNPLMFNGFLVAPPKSPIMREALIQAYNTKDERLTQDYHAICKDLLKIVADNTDVDCKVYQEVKNDSFYAGVKTHNSSGKCILTHYCYIKNIPKIRWYNKYMYNIAFSRVKPFSLYKSFNG